MEKFFFAIVIASSLSLLQACNNPTSEKQNSSNPLVGSWIIDSLASTGSDNIGSLLIAMSFDSTGKNPYHVQFTNDSMTLFQNDTTIINSYQLTGNKNEILIPDDSVRLTYRALADGRMVFVSQDSTSIFLKKVK